MTKRKKKPPGKCVFCNSQGSLTKEHIFPDWLAQYFPKSHGFTDHLTKSPSRGIVKGRLNRPGAVHSKKLRVVCAECNNGWMSRMQEDAKPYLLRMAQRESLDFSKKERDVILKWIVMFCMVLEFADEDSKVIYQKHREQFCKDRTIIGDWQVWIGKYVPEGNHAFQFNRFGARFYDKSDQEVGYLQLAGFTLAHVYIQVHSVFPSGLPWNKGIEKFLSNNDVLPLSECHRLYSDTNRVYTPYCVQKASCEIAIENRFTPFVFKP